MLSYTMFTMDKIFLLLGTNRGDRTRNLRAALAELRRNGIAIVKKSRVYQTRPWGKTDQPDFLNLALRVKTSLEPSELLQTLKGIERKMGRKKGPKWGSRLIDIDILFYDKRIMRTANLSIPHPYFEQRSFAIVPMAELAPNFVDPINAKKMKEYLPEIEHEGVEVYRR